MTFVNKQRQTVNKKAARFVLIAASSFFAVLYLA
jgi:hypothetical protein